MNASNIRFSLTHTRLSPLLNLLISITSLLAALVRHLSSPSLVHPHLPLSKLQIALSVMHHPVFGIIFLPHSINLLHHLSVLSPPSHDPSIHFLSLPFQIDLKLTCSTNPSLHRSSPYPPYCPVPTRLQPYDTALCFSSSVIFF